MIPRAALRGALLKPIVNHRAAITDEVSVGALMRSIDDFDGWPTLRAALLLTALTMTAPRRRPRNAAVRNQSRKISVAYSG